MRNAPYHTDFQHNLMCSVYAPFNVIMHRILEKIKLVHCTVVSCTVIYMQRIGTGSEKLQLYFIITAECDVFFILFAYTNSQALFGTNIIFFTNRLLFS